jgi:hypothetical protein
MREYVEDGFIMIVIVNKEDNNSDFSPRISTRIPTRDM